MDGSKAIDVLLFHVSQGPAVELDREEMGMNI